MDYTIKIKTWQAFLSEASKDGDGIMDRRVRSIMSKVGQVMIGEDYMAVMAQAWKKYKKYYADQ